MSILSVRLLVRMSVHLVTIVNSDNWQTSLSYHLGCRFDGPKEPCIKCGQDPLRERANFFRGGMGWCSVMYREKWHQSCRKNISAMRPFSKLLWLLRGISRCCSRAGRGANLRWWTSSRSYSNRWGGDGKREVWRCRPSNHQHCRRHFDGCDRYCRRGKVAEDAVGSTVCYHHIIVGKNI